MTAPAAAEKETAEVIVDAVLRISEAFVEEDWSIAELRELFDFAIRGDGKSYCAIALHAMAYALDDPVNKS